MTSRTTPKTCGYSRSVSSALRRSASFQHGGADHRQGLQAAFRHRRRPRALALVDVARRVYVERRDQPGDQGDVDERQPLAGEEAEVRAVERAGPGRREQDQFVGDEDRCREDQEEERVAPVEVEGGAEQGDGAARAFQFEVRPPVHRRKDMG
jgi:hypothetical protein